MEDEVESLVAQRLIGQLEARLRDRDKLKTERMLRFKPLAQELAQDEDGLALLTMLLDDTYHDWMHKPPELPPIGSKAQPKKSGGKRGRDRGGQRKDRGRPGRRRDRRS
jgi:ATP-dependent RNA helicase DeaD